MKLAFFSNFLNHHQLPLCCALMKREGVEFVFVATEAINSERLNMGYEDMNQYPFVLRAYESEENELAARDIAREYDVVIFGAAPQTYLRERMQLNKLTFRFCERPFKKGTWRRFVPKVKKKMHDGYVRYKDDNLYILGASAYTSYDLSLCGFNADKCFKWGYFPKVEECDLDELISHKSNNERVEMLYAGRLLKLKRVADSLKAVRSLVKEGVRNIHFTIIGDGEEKNNLESYVQKRGLQEYVTFLPFMSPEAVRGYMDKADIYIFGSNFYEGWGAVVNEAMNSACALLVSHAVGSAAYLVKHGENGFVYECGNVKDLTAKLKILVSDSELRHTMGRNAYNTLKDLWNAEVAADRFLSLCENPSDLLKQGYEEGPCSKAGIVKNNWI